MKIELKKIERTCGDCTLCCKVLGIKELDKPPLVYCTHAIKDHGCAIYATRPESCQTFVCQWLISSWLPEWAKPNKIHGVIGTTDNDENLILWEDPGYPGVASTKLKDILRIIVAAGQLIIVACGKKRTLLGNREAVLEEIGMWDEHVKQKQSIIHNP